MNFGELRQQVVTLTKRPEKVDEAGVAINTAILQYSLATTFAQDLVEGSIPIDPTLYAQNFQISPNFSRFRKFHYLKPDTYKKPIDHIDPLNVVTPAGCEQLNKWYRSGDYIYFKLSSLAANMGYGYYTYPAPLILAADTHWMCELAWPMLLNYAMSEIYKSIGEPNDANICKAKADAFFITLSNDLSTGAVARAQ